MRVDSVSPEEWSVPQELTLTFTESYGEQATLLT